MKTITQCKSIARQMFGVIFYFRFRETWCRMFVQTAQMWDLKEADDLLEELQADPVQSTDNVKVCHDDVIKWKYFPCYWPFVRGIHRSPVNSPHKGQWRGALMFSLICALNKRMVNNRETGEMRRHRAHHGVIVMSRKLWWHHHAMKTISVLLLLYHDIPPVNDGFLSQRASYVELWCFVLC